MPFIADLQLSDANDIQIKPWFTIQNLISNYYSDHVKMKFDKHNVVPLFSH